ncbi:uncharacterized protein LOC132935015 [Metopolophium dirhodum]|uniref:uncharacterized protein LOC132935015 n=1 Tax=Metopolophium dirhodum TaxID=44670 RepID=UPI0029902E05|nr:uncharacterized protein LOC132935015 [Metopolophium dirhodum]
MFDKLMLFIYYFINPLRSRTADDDNRVLSRYDIIRIHGEGFQDDEINNTTDDNNIENNIRLNSFSLRELYAEYLVVRDRNIGLSEWASRAGLISRELNLEFSVLGLVMVDDFMNNSIPMDEFMIQISVQDLFFMIGRITQLHTQHYLFMQLLYRGRRITEMERICEINSDDARNSRIDWKMVTVMILSFYGLTGDTFSFILEMLENKIIVR